MKWLFIIQFLCANWVCLAQEGIYVPDPALREALQKQGFMQGDTIFVQDGVFELNLDKTNISDLTGLCAFRKVGRLKVSGNNLTSLNELPPLITHLYCSGNKIEVLDFEHPTLKVIFAGSNKIKT